MKKRKQKPVPKMHGVKPRVSVSISFDPDKLAKVDDVSGSRGRSRFMDEAVDLRLEQWENKSSLIN